MAQIHSDHPLFGLFRPAYSLNENSKEKEIKLKTYYCYTCKCEFKMLMSDRCPDCGKIGSRKN